MNYTPTPRTIVRRLKKRAAYDASVVHGILDEGFICHIGFAVDAQPYVIPTLYVREDEHLYFHGAVASRMLRSLASGIAVCVTVTLVDGLVLARAAFHHSLNYRSVVVLGVAQPVQDRTERMHALKLLTNRLITGRWEEVRAPNELELKQTMVLKLPLREVSAKVRSGPPVDEEEDYALPVWAGVLPIQTALGNALNDDRVLAQVRQPDPARFRCFIAFKIAENPVSPSGIAISDTLLR